MERTFTVTLDNLNKIIRIASQTALETGELPRSEGVAPFVIDYMVKLNIITEVSNAEGK